MRMCKDLVISSPGTQQHLYLVAREDVVTLMQDRGIRNPDKGDEGFDTHFIDLLKLLISVQPSSQGVMPPPPPPKSSHQNIMHQITKLDAELSKTTEIGTAEAVQGPCL